MSDGARANSSQVILLVDDDADCRQLVREAIRRTAPDVEIYEAGSGEEALRILQQQGPYSQTPRPSLIFLDLEMPGLSGIETARLIRSQERFSDVAVVMMTGVTDDRQKALAMRSGVNSYTNKPVDPERLFETIRLSTEYWLCVHQYAAPAAGSRAA